ncbi:MAG: hypothetical protein NTY65_01050 [Planctomycetota bacterium]|nr:hypothetical protein [Planctomycetota bacterium]
MKTVRCVGLFVGMFALAAYIFVFALGCGSGGNQPQGAVVGVAGCELFPDQELVDAKATLKIGTKVVPVQELEDRVEVTTPTGERGWVRRHAICDAAELARRQANDEVPRHVVCVGRDGNGIFVYGGSLSIANNRPTANAGDAFWLDPSMKGKEFGIVGHQLEGDPAVLFLLTKDEKLARLPLLPIRTSTAPGAAAGKGKTPEVTSSKTDRLTNGGLQSLLLADLAVRTREEPLEYNKPVEDFLAKAKGKAVDWTLSINEVKDDTALAAAGVIQVGMGSMSGDSPWMPGFTVHPHDRSGAAFPMGEKGVLQFRRGKEVPEALFTRLKPKSEVVLSGKVRSAKAVRSPGGILMIDVFLDECEVSVKE